MAAMLATQTNQRAHIQVTGSRVSVPNDPYGRLQYYLHALKTNIDKPWPPFLTDYPNYYRLSKWEKDQIYDVARSFPPEKLPYFLEVDSLPDGLGNEFFKVSSVEETVTLLGIRSNDAQLTAMQRELGNSQHLITIMAYTSGWKYNNYVQPLRQIEQMKAEEIRQARRTEVYASSQKKNTKICVIL